MARTPLHYTFGNHMHWVDMQWLWGYDVLPGCVDDMMRLIRETGARGNVNFDAIGYEKMAAECPDALDTLRRAIAEGLAEPVGCSYGQPYGLFQGGESNIRQLTYGVRATRRTLGVRPRTFWEEEFYFFPQLPQLLAQCGYEGACLFFQWTWHTPELPRETASLIQWEGADGTRLPTLPRSELNVHQWPEDFDGLLDKALAMHAAGPEGDASAPSRLPPAVVQWLELMPTRDWMCRSEVLLPRLKELMRDERFDIRPQTAGDLIATLRAEAEQEQITIPVRRYAMDDVWHGMTLGKNADRHPRTSRRVEHQILEAEALAALAGLFGRPYPSWDVYPTWELDEAWRELLAAQHHDNHECEGLCGFVGYHQMRRAEAAAEEVAGRTHVGIEQRVGRSVATNPLGWTRSIPVYQGSSGWTTLEVPSFGYASARETPNCPNEPRLEQGETIWTLRRGDWAVEIDVQLGLINQIRSPSHPDGVLRKASPLGALSQIVDGKPWHLPAVDHVGWLESTAEVTLDFTDSRADQRAPLSLCVSILPDESGINIAYSGFGTMHRSGAIPRPDPGLKAGLRMAFEPRFAVASLRTDTPYSLDAVRGTGQVCRKYPSGDWMTSPQWFEHLDRAIVSSSLIDLLAADGSGLLVLHDATQQWFRTDTGVEAVLNAYDPWDEGRYDALYQSVSFRVVPHGALDDAGRVRQSLAFSAWIKDAGTVTPQLDVGNHHGPPVGGGGRPEDHPIPTTFGGLEVCNAPGVIAHALHRQSMKAGEHLPDWAGHEMARRTDGACTHPYVVRLAEWNNEPAEVTLKLPGPIAAAAKTNLMGETGAWAFGESPTDAPARLHGTGWLTPEPCDQPTWARGTGIAFQALRFTLRPREVATIMADLIPGRKQWRDLDAKREVWATVHRLDEHDAHGGTP